MAGERNSAFYADFTEWRGYSPTNILGSLLKQIVGELEKLPGEISRTFQEHKEMLGGRGLRKAGVKLLLEDLKRRADQYYHHTPTKIPLLGFTELHYASVFGIAESQLLSWTRQITISIKYIFWVLQYLIQLNWKSIINVLWCCDSIPSPLQDFQDRREVSR